MNSDFFFFVFKDFLRKEMSYLLRDLMLINENKGSASIAATDSPLETEAIALREN